MGFFKKSWDPKGKHCFVTGGSTGMGLGAAVGLARRGAHVTIVARDQTKLDRALKEIEAARQSSSQIFTALSFSVNSAKGAEESIDAAVEAHGGRCPDAFFLCAGKSRPGFWIEQSEEDLKQCMDDTYWIQAWSALAASKRMVREGVKGKIVFVSSILAYFGMVGYASYAPGKFALRGLAESLQSEFLLYGIGIHLCCPGTMFTPGYETENETKPKITLKIEETDSGCQGDFAAEAMIRGVEKGQFHITYDFIGHAFQAASRGSSPGNSGFMDQVYNLIGAVGLPIWRMSVDKQVKAHTAEHYEYLRGKGLI